VLASPLGGFLLQNSINLCVQRSFRQSMLMLDGLRSRLRAVSLQPGTSSRRTTMKVAWSLPLLGAAGKVRSAKMVGAEVVPSLIRHAYLSHLCDECPGPQSNSPFRNGVAGEIRQNTHRAKNVLGTAKATMTATEAAVIIQSHSSISRRCAMA